MPIKPPLHQFECTLLISVFSFFFSVIGWDQSEKFVKVYITLKGVQKIPADDVKVSFTDRYVQTAVINTSS